MNYYQCYYAETLSLAEKAASAFTNNLRRLFENTPDHYDEYVSMVFTLFDVHDNIVLSQQAYSLTLD